ncbi:hypothetical protein RSW84_30885, partial [Escherichia coli]|uniref:hypothetical protein n=1 Tax=Escherichia coli TaxID=562 RepID=UPI0028DE711F
KAGAAGNQDGHKHSFQIVSGKVYQYYLHLFQTITHIAPSAVQTASRRQFMNITRILSQELSATTVQINAAIELLDD